MSERPQASLIERIRKLLAKTEQTGCTQAEAATALAMAGRLATEHNLSMDEIRLGGGEPRESFTEEPVFVTGRWTIEQNLAYNICKQFFFVEGIFNARKGSQKVLFFFGTEANVAIARHTFHSLLASAERLWVTYRVLNKRPAGEARMFKTGVMKGYHDKLKEEREAHAMERDIIQGATGGTALALRRVEDGTALKFREAHPTTRKGSGGFADLAGDQSTLKAGYEAGKRLNLSRAVGGSRQKGIGRL